MDVAAGFRPSGIQPVFQERRHGGARLRPGRDCVLDARGDGLLAEPRDHPAHPKPLEHPTKPNLHISVAHVLEEALERLRPRVVGREHLFAVDDQDPHRRVGGIDEISGDVPERPSVGVDERGVESVHDDAGDLLGILVELPALTSAITLAETAAVDEDVATTSTVARPKTAYPSSASGAA